MFKIVSSRETIRSEIQRMPNATRRRVVLVTPDATAAVLPSMK
jgi:hypothetical protein